MIDSAAKPWAGRFEQPTDAFVEAFTASVGFDHRLYRQDIAGSIAHARMLARQGILDADECAAIVAGLTRIGERIAAGTFEWSEALEDVHMNIEAALTAEIGDAGKRLHTGRSRNDQVATDIRLWLREEIDTLLTGIDTLVGALLDLAEREAGSIMPGFTHLQVAQPITFGHHMMAWVEMLERDAERFRDCRRRVNVMPLWVPPRWRAPAMPSTAPSPPPPSASRARPRTPSTPSRTVTSPSNSPPPPPSR